MTSDTETSFATCLICSLREAKRKWRQRQKLPKMCREYWMPILRKFDLCAPTPNAVRVSKFADDTNFTSHKRTFFPSIRSPIAFPIRVERRLKLFCCSSTERKSLALNAQFYCFMIWKKMEIVSNHNRNIAHLWMAENSLKQRQLLLAENF